MNHTPEQQWSALSALYEEADGLPVHELAGWLAGLEREGHPLLPQLKRMLEAREHLDTDGFLGTLPKLSEDAAGASDWKEGHRVGPYRLVKPLGEGGMAEVWLAERDDGAFKRQVAIKLPYPRPGRETFAVRFDRERDILATLRHPHIAGLYDAGVTKDGQAWLALEYVEGQPISHFCDERKLSVRERVMLFRQVLLAVQHAHANLVIHRDLKPANILVTSQGEVRLLDFGIAKLLEAQGDAIEETELTRQAGRSMTPRYASPEQLTGLPLTTACDVYSLGVVVYELVSGERPYELKVESPAQLEHAILDTEPRAPSRRALSDAQAQVRGTTVKGLRKVLAPELDAIALRCLEKKPSARYLSVDAVLADVDRWLGGEAVLATAPGAWYRFLKFANRHRMGVGLSVGAVLALAAIAAVAIVMGLQAREESARAGAARDFMLSLFKRADQEKARGADITARELLESARKDLLTRLATQPRLQAELLDGIATIQKDMGEYVGADSTYADAARIYEQMGMQREAILTRTAEANVAVRTGNMKLAQSVLQQARAASARFQDDPELNARMSEVEGWIAYSLGETRKAQSLFAVSHGQALEAFGPYHAKTMDALRGQIYAERRLRNFGEALRLLDELESAAAKTAGVNAADLAALARDRSDVLLASGHMRAALDQTLVALSKCISDLGPNRSECRELTYFKVNVMLRLGMGQQAAAEIPILETIAADAKAPGLAADTLLLILKVASLTEPRTKKNNSVERVVRLMDSDAGVALGPNFKTKALLALAEASLRMGAAVEGENWAKAAFELQKLSNASVPATRFGALTYLLLGTSQFYLGRMNESLTTLISAHADFERLYGPDDPLTLLCSLNAALAFEAVGKVEEARSRVERAVPLLGKAMGVDSPTYLQAVQLLDRLRSPGENLPAHSPIRRNRASVRDRSSMAFFS